MKKHETEYEKNRRVLQEYLGQVLKPFQVTTAMELADDYAKEYESNGVCNALMD